MYIYYMYIYSWSSHYPYFSKVIFLEPNKTLGFSTDYIAKLNNKIDVLHVL